MCVLPHPPICRGAHRSRSVESAARPEYYQQFTSWTVEFNLCSQFGAKTHDIGAHGAANTKSASGGGRDTHAHLCNADIVTPETIGSRPRKERAAPRNCVYR